MGCKIGNELGECSTCPEPLPLNQRILDPLLGVLSTFGFALAKDHRILDFGCGSGRHVYELRDAGYEAYGIDLGDFVELRQEADKSWFQLSKDAQIYRLPYPDSYFDVVYSTQVFEHIPCYEPALEEIRRVLRPGGVSMHIFPSKWRPIEPHFFAPLGGVITWEPWLWFWAVCGCRNPNPIHDGMNARQEARENWEQSRMNYTYYSKKEIEFYCRRHFQHVSFAEKQFVEATLHSSGFSRLVKRVSKILPAAFWFYRHFHTKVLILS